MNTVVDPHYLLFFAYVESEKVVMNGRTDRKRFHPVSDNCVCSSCTIFRISDRGITYVRVNLCEMSTGVSVWGAFRSVLLISDRIVRRTVESTVRVNFFLGR